MTTLLSVVPSKCKSVLDLSKLVTNENVALITSEMALWVMFTKNMADNGGIVWNVILLIVLQFIPD